MVSVSSSPSCRVVTRPREAHEPRVREHAALGLAGGARRVLDVDQRVRVDFDGGRRIRRVRLDERGEVESVAVRATVDAENPERGADVRTHLVQQRHELAQRDDRPNSRVAEHEAGIGGPVSGVDGHHDRADPGEPEPTRAAIPPGSAA